MDIINWLKRCNKRCYTVHNKNYIQEKNLNDLTEILSIAISTQNKQMLIFITNNWRHHYMNMSTDYIINNSNQLNYISILIDEAKYLINKE